MNRYHLSAVITSALLAVGCQTAVVRVQPARHPAYLHALADLRQARANLERRGGGFDLRWDEQTAIQQIDAAIREIKNAAIDDGKNLQNHPPIDTMIDYPGRLHRALELLHKAVRDCQEEEDNSFARGLQARAIGHVREAIRLTDQALADAHR